MASLGVVMMEMVMAVHARLRLLSMTANRGMVMIKMATAVPETAAVDDDGQSGHGDDGNGDGHNNSWLSSGQVV